MYTTLAGKQVTVAAFEHTMTLIGYEAQNVTLINAGDGKTGVYPLSNFLNSWSVLNNMAVVVRGKQQQTPGGFTTLTATVVLPKETPPVPQASATSPVPDPTQMTPVAPTIAYTVLPGDTLADIAQRFGTTAEIIAELNQLAFPYVIFSGQVLQIPQGGSSFATPTVVSPETPAAVESPPFENTPATALPGETLAAPREMQIYVVQAGDTLATVARRWKMTWIELARWNNLAYPYQLTEGQILKVP